MEARTTRAALVAAILLVSMGARHRSENFVVETADPRFTAQIAQAAEKYRHDLAVEWLGAAMRNWSQPCPMTVQVGANLGAGGATTFVFDRGEVFGWRMSIQGSAERVLDSVLPHEITHMIFASHFRRPLPRWADEGGATSVEHQSERHKHQTMLVQFLRTGRGIAFAQMFAMKEYPPDVMPLYAQGYSLAEYLIETGGRRKYVEFLGDGLKSDDWPGAVHRHYGISDLGQLQNTWLTWVKQGSPPIKVPETKPAAAPATEALAAARRPRPEPNLIYREPKTTVAASGLPVAAKPSGAAIPSAAAMPPAPPPGFSPPDAAAVAGVRPGAPLALPASGWHPAGTPAPRPAPLPVASVARPEMTDPFRAQIARPQAIESPRETVLSGGQL